MIAKSIRTVLLFIAGLAAAQGLARAGELYVPGRGTLTIPLPAVWQETHRGLSGECSVEMVFERPGPVRGSLQVTVAWSPQGDPAFSTPESVRRSCLSGRKALEGQTVEKELPLQPLGGPQAAGFYYEATDRSYRKPAGAPEPGQYPVITGGILGLGRQLLIFTIMSDAKADPAAKEALEAVRLASWQPPVRMASPARLQGAGVDVLMDLAGFEQLGGLRPIRGAYSQVGFYNQADGLSLSVLVDDLAGQSLADLERLGKTNSAGLAKLLAGGQVRSEKVAEPEGFLISYPADSGLEGIFQAQWYFETIHRGKWLELHFSKMFRNGSDVGPTHAEVLRLVRSLRLPPEGR